MRCWGLFLLALRLFGAPVGNPSIPFLLDEGFFIPDTSWSNPGLGVIGDFLFHKKLSSGSKPLITERWKFWKKEQDEGPSFKTSLRSACVSGNSQLASFTWSIRERFNLQIRLGSGRYDLFWREKSYSFLGKVNGGLIWSGDAKFMLFSVKNTLFSFDFQGGGFDWMRGPFTVDERFTSKNSLAKTRYWQIGGSIAQKISYFSPYIGFLVQKMRMKVSSLPTKAARFKDKNPVGPFGGFSISTGEKFLLNFEWRGWFEEGLALSADVRF